MRIVFLGSPEFALPALRRLIMSEHEVVAVYTQPDRPVGRGRRLTPPPVKALAIERGLEVRQPASISAADSVEALRRFTPDIGVIAAYGQILRPPVLDVPPLGILNVHASLLPRWRGAAPIPAAILAGDAETGATIMKVVRELDAGPVLASVVIPIGANDTTASLTPHIAEAGAELLLDVLPKWERGEIDAVEQDATLATYAPQIRKEHAHIDWDRDATTIWRQVRAYNPWPVAYSYLDGAPLRILGAVPLEQPGPADPGTVLAPPEGSPAGFAVATAKGLLGVTTVQAAGGRPLPAADFVRGHHAIIGKRLGSGN
ncbi:MAG: methionyl-tRNA formyltransferase [Dehalococcoidia bacterium]